MSTVVTPYKSAPRVEMWAHKRYHLKGQERCIVTPMASDGTNDSSRVLVRVVEVPQQGRGARLRVGQEIVTTWARLKPITGGAS